MREESLYFSFHAQRWRIRLSNRVYWLVAAKAKWKFQLNAVLFSLNATISAPRCSRAAALACALALCFAMLAAQETTDQQTYPVHGTVLDSATHQPIARALVSTQEDAVLTDNGGRFELSLPAGRAAFMIRRPGYGQGPRGMSTPHIVQVGANMPEVTFYLTPQSLIIGHVTLSTGDQADGIRVMACRKTIINGREQWTMQRMATTNQEGVFRIAGLRPGNYLLYTMAASDLNRPAPAGATIYGYPPVYYPGVTDISSAGILALTAGQQAEADFTLTRQPFYAVTVMEPQVEGRRIGLLQVHDAGGRFMGFPQHPNLQQGAVQVNVPNGRYFVEARGGFGGLGSGQSPAYGRVDFTVSDAPIEGLTIAPLPLHAIPVTVRKDFTQQQNGPRNGTISFPNGSEPDINAALNLTLTPADELFGQPAGMSGLRPVPGANDGISFELENVSPGRYWVGTTPSQGYVSSISSGGVDLAREPLVVGPGGTSASIEITLRDDSGSISGQITTGQPDTAPGVNGSVVLGEQSHVYIYAIPLFATTIDQLPQGGRQDSGKFTIPNLPPGSYRVVAFDAPQEIDFRSPESLAAYAGKGQTVIVEAGGVANAEVAVIETNGMGSAQ